MPKKAPIDKELATAIKAAMKRPMNFVAVVKSPAEGSLFISKTKVDKEAVAESKEKLGGGKAFKGKCQGKDGKLVFMVNKEPPATLGAVLAKYAKIYAGLKIKAEAVFAQELADEVDLKGKSEESLKRRAATKAINEALQDQDQDVHRKRMLGPDTQDRGYEKNVTGPANAALLKASEELMTGKKLLPGTIAELRAVLVQLAEARQHYSAKVQGASETDEQRQRKVLAITKREEAIRKVLAQVGGGKDAANKSPKTDEGETTERETSEGEGSVADSRSIKSELETLSGEIASVSESLSAQERKSLQTSLKRVKSLRDSRQYNDAQDEIDNARSILSRNGKSDSSEDNLYVEESSVDESTSQGPSSQQSSSDESSSDETSSEESEREGKSGDDESAELDPEGDSANEESSSDESSSEDYSSESETGEDASRSSDSTDSLQEQEGLEDQASEAMTLAAAPEALRKAAVVWKQGEKSVAQQINKLQAAILKINDSRSARIAKGLNRLNLGLPGLASVLESIAKAKEEGQDGTLETLVAQARSMLDVAAKFANDHPLVKEVDANPFVPLKLKAALQTLIRDARNALK